MGDFNEHVLFGFLSAFTLLYLFNDHISFSSPVIISSSIALLIGSILPDIDHKKSRIHRSARAAVSIGIAIILSVFISSNIQLRAIVFLICSTLIYSSFKLLKIKHRGFTHSISFAVIIISLTILTSFYIISSTVPGIAIGVGIFSHLILDTEFKLS